MGRCRAGTSACNAAGTAFEGCLGAVVPAAETCDALDNDCDGSVDEGDPGGGAACSTGQQGVCAAGMTACAGGTIVCNRNVNPGSDVCDGLDNDCDGSVDEGNPGGGAACSTGQQGVCAAGTTVCTAGMIVCSRNINPGPETCDGQDNDCDGPVDEGNPGGGAVCGSDVGECVAGVLTCTGGSLVCSGSVGPGPEVCDGLDNDCDGPVDESLPVDAQEPNNSCATVHALPAVGSDQTLTQSTLTIYPAGDSDYFRIVATETDGTCACCDPFFRMDEDYHLRVTLTVPPGAGSYQFCADLGTCNTFANCQTVTQGNSGNYDFPLDGSCSAVDSYSVFVRISPAGAPGFSCQPYTLSYVSDALVCN